MTALEQQYVDAPAATAVLDPPVAADAAAPPALPTPPPGQWDNTDTDDFSGGMPLWECVRVARRGLSNNKMRTGLTMLGIIIGVGAVIAMVSMGRGASQSVSAQINSLGTNLLTVRAGNNRLGFGGGGGNNSLRLGDATAITRFKNSVAAVAPQVQGNAALRIGDQTENTSVIGSSAAYSQVNNAPVQDGRFITDGDDAGRTKVAVVGTTVVGNLLGDPNAKAVGETLEINHSVYHIIGVLKTKGSGAFGQDQDDIVVIPITTALRRVFNRTNVNSIGIECSTPKTMDLATEQVSNLLRQRHHLQPPFPDNDDFSIRSQASLLETSQSVTGTLTTLLAGVAVVSLLVGGIGIMNIMLVSVTERTREIGLRKAVGATSGDIMMQFLIESLVMALMGGLIGVVIGVGTSHLIATKMGWATVVEPTVILIAVGVSAAIGVGFGLYPAAKAANQSPIDALRYE